MSSTYRCGLLTPSRVAGAGMRNAEWLGPQTLGVEVTEAALAAECGLGNIDPQHGFGGGAGRTAIEAALAWSLPPDGASLVTIRPDADALGAMAVLTLRQSGALDAAALSRIELVAACDSFEQGDWRTWIRRLGPLPRRVSEDEVSAHPLAYRIAAAIAGDRACSLAARVARLGDWLRNGVFDPRGLADAERIARATAEAYNGGGLTITTTCGGRVARLRGATPAGLQLAYRLAPIIVAEAGDVSPRKVTIAQFEKGWIDMRTVTAALRELEPGWGGSDTIVGSPQGIGTTLSAATIEGVVEAALIAPPR